MYPKPKYKKKKLIRNPKPTFGDTCIICGKPYAELHEIFYGKNSQLSKLYGLQVRLCDEDHRGTDGVHGKNGHELDIKLKQYGQRLFEETHTREEFRAIFGKSYL